MKKLWPRLLALAVLRGFACTAIARPRPGPPPWPELSLARWHFDELLALRTNLTSAELAVAQRAESWSGYALTRAGDSVLPVWLPALDAAGHTNLALGTGALRFWFRPNWTSGESLRLTGFPRLLELARATPVGPEVLWSLHLDAAGNTLFLAEVAGRSAVDVLSAPVAWQAGDWHLVVLAWNPTGTELYLDGELAARGGALSLPVGLTPASAGIVLGSDPAGGNLAQGQFEEVTAFRAYDARRQPYYYASRSQVAALGPVTPEEDAARARQRKLLQAARAAASLVESGASGPLTFDSLNPCPTNGPVCMTNLFYSFATNTGWTMNFDVAGGTNGILYDVFTSAALAGTNIAQAQWYWVTNTYTCNPVVLTNQLTNASFYILGLTNDTDGGGLSDAFEQLVTGGDIHDPSDDPLPPTVSIEAADSVAVEQDAANTARFAVRRRGGFLKQILTVALQVSGTASSGLDYLLSGVTDTGTNLLVTFPPWQTAVEVVLTPRSDNLAEGTETATLTLTTNLTLWQLAPPRHTATAWVLEEYTRTYTTTNDFKLGVLSGLETVQGAGDGQLQFQTNLPPQFPFINVACSGRGTVARINTTNGLAIGEYRTMPVSEQSPFSNPSRTTVDQYGNVWVANRDANTLPDYSSAGSITRIGLIIGGTRYSKVGSNYTENPLGQYLSLSTATYNTCIDRDGDGYIRTSRGLADILPWSNNRAGLSEVDSYGGR